MELVVRDALSNDPMAVHFEHGQVSISAAELGLTTDCYLSPGWIDLQVNGFAGVDLNAPEVSPGDLDRVARRLWEEGVTAFFPTVVTAPPAQIERTMGVFARACDSEPAACVSVAGIHLEGPYLSPIEGARGAHNPAHMHAPDWNEFSRWQEASGGRIRLVTLAPELPGAIAFIGRLVRSGVVVAIGHTLAGSPELALAADAGARLSTHLGNGIPAMLPRHPNPIWDQLADDRLYASLIFDGHHLPPSVMRVLVRAKGIAKTILVSDAVSFARMAPGIYASTIGGQVELHPNQRLSLVGTPYLAGSAISLKDAVEKAVSLAGCSLAESLQMAASNPSQALGLRLAENRTLIRWDDSQNRATVLATVVSGQVVYQSSELHYELSEVEQ